MADDTTAFADPLHQVPDERKDKTGAMRAKAYRQRKKQMAELTTSSAPPSSEPCKSAPVKGRRRCRMHGGADGSGAPRGSKNGNYKHGRYTKEVQATRRWLREATKLLHSFR